MPLVAALLFRGGSMVHPSFRSISKTISASVTFIGPSRVKFSLDNNPYELVAPISSFVTLVEKFPTTLSAFYALIACERAQNGI
jgi:hypothetical protein